MHGISTKSHHSTTKSLKRNYSRRDLRIIELTLNQLEVEKCRRQRVTQTPLF